MTTNMESTFYKIPGSDFVWENPEIELITDQGGAPIIKDAHLTDMTITLMVRFKLEYESPNQFDPSMTMTRSMRKVWDCGPIPVDSFQYDPVSTQTRFFAKLSDYQCDSDGNYLNELS